MIAQSPGSLHHAMPIYEFECHACGHRFDELMRLSDPDPAACPACGAAAVHRRVSAPQFRLAGGGWYETDFKGDKDKKRNLAGAEAEPAAKPDAKPESKAEGASPAPSAAPAPASPAPSPAPATPSGGAT
jgi:putative FmdB family regulatory protein